MARRRHDVNKVRASREGHEYHEAWSGITRRRSPLQGFEWKSNIAYCHACESEWVIKIKGSSPELSIFSESRNGPLFLSEYKDTSDI
jgi:hypothetical protein